MRNVKGFRVHKMLIKTMTRVPGTVENWVGPHLQSQQAGRAGSVLCNLIKGEILTKQSESKPDISPKPSKQFKWGTGKSKIQKSSRFQNTGGKHEGQKCWK